MFLIRFVPILAVVIALASFGACCKKSCEKPCERPCEPKVRCAPKKCCSKCKMPKKECCCYEKY